MMVTIATPGGSAHSVVPEPSCGSNPGKPECDITPAPRWSPSHQAFVRKETREEALQRYLMIARVIEKTAVAMTTPTKHEDGTEEVAPWPWAASELAQALVTIAHHESGFRRDVHSGIGPSALGDCAYWDLKGNRMSLEHARAAGVAVRTACRSVCLVQINTGGLDKARFGYTGREMVGLDEASTERCFAAGARAFADARARCAATRVYNWFERSVTSYGTGAFCEKDAAWTAARVNTFERIGKVTAEMLPKEARVLFGAEAADSTPPEEE
ncbi:MAG TPA: hypothetical protein VE093_46540 [Polyangiaceae bacterium]|jgi:hypothetical protein|nr:hypothetical protein [Polyangiaceae bacterium]